MYNGSLFSQYCLQNAFIDIGGGEETIKISVRTCLFAVVAVTLWQNHIIATVFCR
ncbi:hypothetical protein GCWU000325_02654 [Alloprevotella tannerae ATCC 51259]|uniref:Uncharacterized protein n=1 Tax=Alloprevotella tannerae ATCC 51259 TaxID=626522 RepID=C9LK89_9BACT|nr:hypothetical protein GCWU000325_02654 [Alloprevotella tannerae ATCC 51259]